MALRMWSQRISAKTYTSAAAQSRRIHRHWQVAPYFFLLPGLLFIALWVYIPLLQTFWLSLFHGNLVGGPSHFVGLKNYMMIVQLPELWQSLTNTAIYTLGMVVLAVMLPLGIALLLAQVKGFLGTLYQSILFTPVIMAPIVVSLIWLWMINPVQGVLSRLGSVLLGWHDVSWLNDHRTALWVIVGITAWKTFGFSLTLFLATLKGINPDYLAAARTDGASEWQITRFIVLPLLTPTLFFLVFYTIIFAGQWTFGPIQVLTQGGPDNVTTNVYYLLYQFGFEFFNTGYASALAVLLFIGLVGVTLVATPFINRKAYYEN
jgi:multiple sugar transport system permease protein